MKDLDFIDDFLDEKEGEEKSKNITEGDAKDWEDFWHRSNEDSGE
tara:strand:+ start:7344 stop:7478 length:135 start_codon:yes stop_codon:yes gene_type:complete